MILLQNRSLGQPSKFTGCWGLDCSNPPTRRVSAEASTCWVTPTNLFSDLLSVFFSARHLAK